MALIVQKYGGTSVGDVDRICGVAQRVKGYVDQGHQVVVVVSAMSGETNRLVSMGRDIGGDHGSAREMDVLTASGEQVTISLLSLGLLSIGVQAKSFLADQISIKTDNVHGKARIQEIDTDALRAELDAEGEWYFDEATHKLFYHPPAGIVRFSPHSAHGVV